MYQDEIDGFAFEGRGKLERIESFTGKTGKQTLTLVIRIDGQWPQMIPFKVFGRLVDEANDWQAGQTLQISGRLGGREWNGKCYGDNVATKVRVLDGQKQQPQQQEMKTGAHPQRTAPDEDSVPF